MDAFLPTYVALWLLVFGQGLVILGLVRTVYELRVKGGDSEGGERWRGHKLPDFVAADLSERRVSTADYSGRKLALLFVSPNCVSCTTTLEEAAGLKFKADGNVVVVCRADRRSCASLVAEHGLDQLGVPVIADEDLEISRLLDINAVPTAVLVNEEGRIASYGYPMRDGDLAYNEDQTTIGVPA